jgi:hypothetical protein
MDPILEERKRVEQILEQNKQRQFVDRILHREKYPVIRLPNGQKATHLMSWAEDGGKYYVFPMIQYDGKQLKQYDKWQEAFDNARKTNDFIEFDNPLDADWFSKRYKAAWGE